MSASDEEEYEDLYPKPEARRHFKTHKRRGTPPKPKPPPHRRVLCYDEKNKVIFATEEAAQAFVDDVWWKKALRWRSYRCPHGDHWHVTSQGQKLDGVG